MFYQIQVCHSIRSKPRSDTPQQSGRALSSIRMKSLPFIWADIWIKDLIPISKTSYGSSMEHMQVSVQPSEIPAQTRIQLCLSTVLD
ncbi:hypothetical protein TNCV_3211 [Trichonephila clavipes]|nr:hypothetical protein TNCV_3211 [Trichonephila clavipes]